MNLIDKNINKIKTKTKPELCIGIHFIAKLKNKFIDCFGGESSSPYLFCKPNETMNETEEKKGHRKQKYRTTKSESFIIINNCRI